MKRNISKAVSDDKEEILKLYNSVKGSECCPWNEDYPGLQELEYDLGRESIFVMRDENNEIIASISIDEDKNVDSLEFWTKELFPGGELSRLAVCKKMQNQGIAVDMLKYGMDVLRQRGLKSVRFLVNKANEKAIRSYSHMDFNVVGDCFMYEQDFWCYEKEIGDF